MILRQSSNTHRKYCTNIRIRRLISTSSPSQNVPDAGLHPSPQSIHDIPPQFTKATGPFDAQPQLRPQVASPSPYLTQTPPKEHKMKTTLSSFLNRPASLTLLPSPKSSMDPTSDIYFPKSQMHHTLAVIDACLYGLYDVSRARSLFNRLREERKGHPLLSVKLYNQVLYAYLAKAMTTSSEGERKNMLDEFWSLYDVLSHESEVKVTPCTYALAFLANLRFPDTVTSQRSDLILARSPEDVLKSALENWVSLADIVSDAYLMEAGAVMDAVRLISRTAVKIGNMDVVKELSVVKSVMQSIDSLEYGDGEKDGKGADPLEGIPEIKPVLKRSSSKGGNEDDMEPMTPEQLEQQIPFNLRNLRNRLLSTHRTRKLLSDPSDSENPTATTDSQDLWTGSNSTPHLRQTHLETLTFTIAQTRIQHELAELKRASKLGELSMSKKGVRVLMWRWHLELIERIKAAMSVLKVQEEKALKSIKEKAIPKSRAVSIHPFLSILKPESLSFLTISHLLLLHGAGGVENGTKTTRAVLNIGKSIEQEYHAILARQIAPLSSAKPLDDFSTDSQPIPVDYYSAAEYRKLYEKRVMMRRSMDLDEKWTGTWTQSVRAKVGAFLIDLLMDCATVERFAYDEHGNEVYAIRRLPGF